MLVRKWQAARGTMMGARTGTQYLKQLQEHSPEFWFGGERVTDTTTHPATAQAAAEIARLYDLALEPENAELALFPSPLTGDPVSAQFLLPRSREELAQRGRMHRLWSDATYGLMGRTTDFIGAMLTAWTVNADFFGPYADNVRRYFEHVRENDLFLTHALIDPPVDRSKPASQQPDPHTYLGVAGETSEGLIVRGAKMFATAAPYADEILCWPFALRTPSEAESPYMIAFAVPTDAPGLRFIGREPYGDGNRFDRPLASRFDEMDAVAVFDDVLVPWERVFINQDPEQVKNIWKVNSNAFTGYQTSIRMLSKLIFAAGVARKATGMVGTDEFPQVRDALGEMTTYIELTKAAIVAAEATAQPDAEGYYSPALGPMFAIRNSANRWYPRVRELFQSILAGGLLFQPASVTGFASATAPDIERFFRAAEVSAEERIKLMNVACDLAVHSFGSRHELYERLYAGDPMFLRIMTQFLAYDWTEPLRAVDHLLGSYSAATVLDELANSSHG